MKLENLTDVRTAVYAFKDLALRRAGAVEHAAELKGGGRLVEAPDYVVPDFMSPWQAPETARFRFTDTGAAVMRAVLASWTPPTLADLMEFDGQVNENEVRRAQQAVVSAAADVAVEWAVYAPVRTNHVGRERWCLVDVTPGSLPTSGAALVPAVHEALTAWAVRWLVWVGTDTPATFLPRRAA